jgi:hypothetical protein
VSTLIDERSRQCGGFGFFVAKLPLLFLNIKPLTLYLEPQPTEYRHIKVRDPDQRKPGKQITSPEREYQVVARYRQPEYCDVVAEAELTRECIKELALNYLSAILAAAHTVLVRLSENFLVRYRPGSARHRDSQNEKQNNLGTEVRIL